MIDCPLASSDFSGTFLVERCEVPLSGLYADSIQCIIYTGLSGCRLCRQMEIDAARG